MRTTFLAQAAVATSMTMMIAAVGCDNPNVQARRESADAVRKADAQLTRLSLSVTYPLPHDRRESGYEEVLATLKAAPSVDAQDAAVKALTAKAQMGLARVKLEQAQETDAKLARLQLTIMNLIDIAIERDVMARNDAALTFDEQRGQIAEIERLARERGADLTAEKRRLESEIATMEQQAASEREQAAQVREQSARTADQATRTDNLDEKDRLIREAREIGRRADAHDRRAAEIEAELDNTQPLLEHVNTLLAQTEAEIRNVETARQAFASREEQARREAEELRADVTQMSDMIANQYQSLAQQRAETLDPLFTAAIEHAEGAEAAAAAAMSNSRNEAHRVLAATTSQLLGSANLDYARSVERFAGLVASLDQYASQLNRGSEDAATLASLNQKGAELRAAAQAAYASAREAIEPIADVANPGDPITQLLQGIQRSELIASGAEVEPMGTDGAAPAQAPGEPQTNAEGTPENSPRAVFDEAARLVRAQDFAGLTGIVFTDSPVEEQFITSVRSMLSGVTDLDAAAQAEYGRGLVAIITDPEIQDAVMTSLQNLTGQPVSRDELGPLSEISGGGNAVEELAAHFEEAGAAAVFAYDNSGTYAWVESPAELSDMAFVLVDGAWLIDLDVEEPMLTMAGDMIGALAPVLTGTANRVRNGEYGDELMMVQGLLGEAMEALGSVQAPQMSEEEMQEMMRQMQEQQQQQRGRDGGG